MHKVSVIKCNSYKKEIVKKALKESLNLINFKFHKGMKILIKPNLLLPCKPEKAITTHPVIIEELCKILSKHKAEIHIGDSASNNTNLALEVCGIRGLEKYAKIINFESEEQKIVQIDKVGKVLLPKILFDVDLVINLAKMKTHSLTGVTLCIKNLYGCIPGRLKEEYHRKFASLNDFSKLLAGLHEKILPELNIIDGVIGLEGDGPGALGKPKNSGLIIVSRNAFAADVIASEIMGFSSERICTNKFSGLKKENIEVLGDGKNIKLNFKKPKTQYIHFFMPLSKFLPKSQIKFEKQKCKLCGICAKKCPLKAISLSPFPSCNNKTCIQCLCCIEVCPNGAVYLCEPWIRQAAKNIANSLSKT